MSHPHCFGDEQYTSNRDLNHHQIRRESDWFGRIYVCVTPPPHTHTHTLDYPPPPLPPPTPIYMTPGHLIGWESERFGWIYVPPPSPSLSIYIAPGLTPTSDWWGIRAFWSVIYVTPPHHDATNTHNAWT